MALRHSIVKVYYKRVMKPVFFRLDPEEVHNRIIAIGIFFSSTPFIRAFLSFLLSYSNSILNQTIKGITFKNPIGLSAGFDKNGELTKILPYVGFGFEEVGSITAKPCEGNPKPRLWRHPDLKSIRVHYGLKNEGAQVLSKKLGKMKFKFPVGISIAKTNCQETVDTESAVEDYLTTWKLFEGIGDYVTINISCPNAFGGQPFSDPDKLERLFEAMGGCGDRVVFVKLSPDLSLEEVDRLATISEKYGVSGFICSNLTKKHNFEKGGLSGKPVEGLSEAHLSHLYKRFGDKMVLIGVGGVFSAKDAYKKIRQGASLVQMITGMIYEGPQVIGEINRGLVKLLKRDGFSSIKEAIGADHR